MAIIKELLGKKPQIGQDCFLAETAAIIGDVSLGKGCSVWYSAVIRGDVNTITIGENTNIQDCSCVHATYQTGPTKIGNNVSIGHNVTVHACTIHDGALIGMGATLLDGCEIGEGAVVAAGALVLSNTKIGKGELWGGVPAKYIKQAKEGQAEHYATNYKLYSSWYKAAERLTNNRPARVWNAVPSARKHSHYWLPRLDKKNMRQPISVKRSACFLDYRGADFFIFTREFI